MSSVDSGGGAAQEIIKTFQAKSEELVDENVGEKNVAVGESERSLAKEAPAEEKKAETHAKPLHERHFVVQDVSETEDEGDSARYKQVNQSTRDAAQKKAKDNPEFNVKSLILLRSKIKDKNTPDEILEIVKESYPDVSLADEALDFLMDAAKDEPELLNKIKEAKDTFNQQSGREITAGRNIAEEARAAASQGLGTPVSLREMYREITGNPRDANTLFNELAVKYPYKEMLKVVDFLLHSMGADLKKGPSISKGEMHNIWKEVRTIQAILGVYRFFNKRMDLVRSMMANEGLPVPKELNFENLAKCFMSLISERYINSSKVLGTAARLGITDSIDGQIVAFSQFRDAVRQVSVQLIYRSIDHRDDVFKAIIETLDGLEDQKDELAELETLHQLHEGLPLSSENKATPMDIDPSDPDAMEVVEPGDER